LYFIPNTLSRALNAYMVATWVKQSSYSLPALTHINDPAGSRWTFLTNQSLHLWSLSLDAQGKSKKSSSEHKPGNKNW